MLQLQAHRGVCTEYPENTMSAFRGAICQDYKIIELDPNVTADGKFVILHDDTINRTARRQDKSEVEESRKITEITYDEASGYDYGIWFSSKFEGEKLPLLSEVLQLARENGVLLKIDNKIWRFPEKYRDSFWQLLRDSGAKIGITCNSLETAYRAVKELPNTEIHYDGEVTEEILKELCSLNERLVVWLPFQSEETSWVKVPFATEELCRLVKRYAKLGIWIVSRYEDFDEIRERFDPDVVETPGQIKPMNNPGRMVDMHTHSEHSHDSTCRIRDMARRQQERGMYGFAVTDHCDVFGCQKEDVTVRIRESLEEVKFLRGEKNTAVCEKDKKEAAVLAKGEKGSVASEKTLEKDLDIHILSGIEIGEGMWYPQVTEKALGMCDYDVVIGSVHTIRYKQYDMPYSGIDFSAMGAEECYGYLDCYLDDVFQMVQNIPCDIAAHLGCPMRYMNGKYGMDIDWRRFEEKIRKILRFMIQHGIALEVNTSCMCENGVDWLDQDWLLGVYQEMGGQLITLGSDAHICENAAKEFERAAALLRKHGFRNVFYYEKRKCIPCAI